MKACDDALQGFNFFLRSRFPIKLVLIFSCFLLVTNILSATTYYSNSGDPTVLSKWWTNTNGTGSHPSNFTTSGDIFVLQSGQTCTTANNNDWIVGSGVIVRVDGILSINGVNSDVTINGTIIFTDASSTQVIMAGAGSGNSITINGTVKTANVNGLQGANCSLIVNAFKKTVTYGASAIYEFNATANQSTLGLPASITDLIVNSTNNVTINSSTTITNTLTLTNGILVIPTGITINITSGSAIAGSGFGASKHINTQVNTGTGAQGFIRAGNVTGTYTFPTGNGTYYLPAVVSASGTNDFSVNVFQGATTNGAPNGTAFSNAIKQTIVDAIWEVSRNSGSSSATLQLSWPNALEGSTFSTYANGSIGISHYSGSWDAASGSGDQVANLAARNALTSFSPFYVGQSSIPLSLDFGVINVYSKSKEVEVDWISLNETNVEYYIIERSTDASPFITSGYVNASVNNFSEKKYSWIDSEPLDGKSYYRIKAVETGGKYKYSRAVTITNTFLISKKVLLYPNPVLGNRITIQVEDINAGLYQLDVYDMNRKQVYTQSFNHIGGTFSEIIQLPSGINRGIYNLRINGKNISVVKTFSVL